MLLYLWLLLYFPPISEGKCAKNYYFDGLLEGCQPCSNRCNSPPTICATFCTHSASNEVGQYRNVRLILIVLFVFVAACTVLTVVLQVIRRKACRPILKAKGPQDHETSESERSSDTTEQSDDFLSTDNALVEKEERNQQTHYNSSLPLPSTEEGTTVLVTTKTIQTYNCSTHYKEDVMLGVWRSGIV